MELMDNKVIVDINKPYALQDSVKISPTFRDIYTRTRQIIIP